MYSSLLPSSKLNCLSFSIPFYIWRTPVYVFAGKRTRSRRHQRRQRGGFEWRMLGGDLRCRANIAVGLRFSFFLGEHERQERCSQASMKHQPCWDLSPPDLAPFEPSAGSHTNTSLLFAFSSPLFWFNPLNFSILLCADAFCLCL
jgi:hypothetical protein